MRAHVFQPGGQPVAAPQLSAIVPTVIMAGAALNALVVRGVESVAAGAWAPTFGISPFQLVALFVAARLSLGSGAAGRPRHAFVVDALALVLILVPSSALSWLALALYAGSHAVGATDERRLGALLFLALAIAALWSSVVLKWIAGPVTTAEAVMVGKLVSLLRPDITQTGNVIGNPDTHSLILMTRCTTADALPTAIVSLVGVALLLGRPSRGALCRAGAVLAAALLIANLLRLAAMTWSGEAYALVHGPIGSNIFDALEAIAVLGLGHWAANAGSGS